MGMLKYDCHAKGRWSSSKFDGLLTEMRWSSPRFDCLFAEVRSMNVTSISFLLNERSFLLDVFHDEIILCYSLSLYFSSHLTQVLFHRYYLCTKNI